MAKVRAENWRGKVESKFLINMLKIIHWSGIKKYYQNYGYLKFADYDDFQSTMQSTIPTFDK
jgi:hypothetical protein